MSYTIFITIFSILIPSTFIPMVYSGGDLVAEVGEIVGSERHFAWRDHTTVEVSDHDGDGSGEHSMEKVHTVESDPDDVVGGVKNSFKIEEEVGDGYGEYLTVDGEVLKFED